VIGHRWFLLLILDSWREPKFVDPWWLDVHVHLDPLLLDTLPATLEGSLDVFIPAIVSQGKANPAKDNFGVSSRRVVVLEKFGVRWDS
jgi:hypothetical protein